MKNDIDRKLKKILGYPSSVAENFLHLSENKYKKRGRPAIFKKTLPICKSYARFPEIKLPKSYRTKKSDLLKVLMTRRSQRNPSKKFLGLDEISFILYYSAGISYEKTELILRTYPSAGALFPCEIYIISLNTELSSIPFVFHYYPLNHSLEKLWKVNRTSLKKAIIQKEPLKFPLIILITAIFAKSTIKYGYRGYRYAFMEAGHIGQNILLISRFLNLNSFPLGGFIEKEINNILDIDGLNESILYMFPIG